MAGEAWRSLIPKEKTDSELRMARWKAEANSDVAGWFLLGVICVLAIALLVALCL